MADAGAPDGDAIRRRMRDAIERRLGIDARGLAAFRILAGLLLIADLTLRSRHLVTFYTDAGVLPRSALVELYPLLSRLSIHALSGAASFQAALFALAAAVAALLTVGYRTRTAAVVSWVLLVSLQTRNYAALNGGDTVLLVLLFFGLFLPLGGRWSIDALRSEGSSTRTHRSDARADRESRECVASPATAAILLQVVFIYATNAVFKLRGEAWRSGEALAYVLSIDRHAIFLGPHLAEYPTLLSAVTYLWVGMLVCSPLLIAFADRIRTAAVVAFIAAHLGMAATMPLGLFPAAMITGLILFLPHGVWDAVEVRTASMGERIGFGRIERRFERLSPPKPIVPLRLRRAVGRSATIVATVLLVGSAAWQIVAINVVEAPADAPIDPAEHSWKLFAPDPPSTEGWYVVPAEFDSGVEIDAYRLSPVSWDRPPDGETYRSTRWRKYLTDVRRGGETERRHLAGYLCDRASDRYGSPPDSIALYYLERPAGVNSPGSATRIELGVYSCSDV